MGDEGHDEEQERPLTDEDRLILAESYIDDRNRFITKLRADLARVTAERDALQKCSVCQSPAGIPWCKGCHDLLQESRDELYGAALKAEADLATARERERKLREVLREVEWGQSTLYGDDERFYCPWCHNGHGTGHNPGCKLAAVLAEVEQSTQQG